jgi:hypothetical protein
MGINLFVFVAVAVFVVFLFFVPSSSKREGGAGQYKRGKLMTDNELEFFGRLIAALPGHYVFPQVSMSALLEASSGDKKQAHSDRLRIAQQRVDYLVCDANCAIVAVVELDDRTHSSIKDQQRDARLSQGGIRTVRFQSRDKPTKEAIHASVLSVPTPLSNAAAVT